MNIIYITSLNYKNYKFDIHMVDGKIDVRSTDIYVSQSIINELKKLCFDRNKIKIENCFRITKKNLLGVIVTESLCVGMLLGTYKNEDIEKIKTLDVPEQAILNLDINVNNINQNYDLELYSNYISALYSNPYLSTADKKEFLKRFCYINENKDNINQKEIINTLSNIRIVRHEEQNRNVLGDFIIDNNHRPVINLYAGSTEETLIHEQYHALKYNTYYWDKVYFYNDSFIGNDIYMNLSPEEKIKCEKKEIIGNMIEEAHTSILTAKEDKTKNMNYSYQEEVYLYKMYEKIFGYEKMEQIMLSSGQVVDFLNAFLEVGCTKEEAVAFVARLDLFNTIISKKMDIDTSNLRYQLCDDLLYVYNKKFGHNDDLMLAATIDSISANINVENLTLLEENYQNKDLMQEVIENEIQINKYIDENIIFDEYMNYGINSLNIDYFTDNTPTIYIKTDSYYTLEFKIDSNKNLLVLNDATHDSEKFQMLQNLYDDYLDYANRTYNESNYCKYFAALYANSNIEVDEKIEFLEYYDSFTEEDFNDDNLMRFLLSNKSPKIRKYLIKKQNKLGQSR